MHTQYWLLIEIKMFSVKRIIINMITYYDLIVKRSFFMMIYYVLLAIYYLGKFI